MKLTGKQAREIVYGDDENWEEVTKRTIVESSRWAILYCGIFRHKSSKKTYRFYWRQGATEMQDESPYEYEDSYEPKEVIQKEVKVMEWVEI